MVGTGPMIERDVTAQLFSRLICEAREELFLSMLNAFAAMGPLL